MTLSFTIHTLTDAAEQLWQHGKPFTVWAFHAPMSGGKTTLIYSLCTDVLQTKDTVSSPTFAIINEYNSPVAGIIYHMDWYRLQGEEEALQAGVEDGLISGSLCLVEWPDIAPALLPDDTFHIYISIINETTRLLTTV